MKITDLKVHMLTGHWGDDPWFPRYLFPTAFVQVLTDAKLDGLGEASCAFFIPESVPPVAEFFKPTLMGRDPMDIESLTEAMFSSSSWWARAGVGRAVISAIELALWDLKGKALGEPVYKLIGGKVRDRVPVYASGGATYWPVDENVRKVAHYHKLGYRATKLGTMPYYVQRASKTSGHVAKPPVAFPFSQKVNNLERCFARLRREFGGDMDLAVDGHQGATAHPIAAPEAIAIAQALAPHRLRFYEEPLCYTNVEGYRELRARSPIPIAGGESLCGLDQFHAFVSKGGLDFVQPDAGNAGGLVETLRIFDYAKAFGLGALPHVGGTFGPVLAASWHIAAARSNVAFLEHVPAARSIHDDFLIDSFAIKDGTLGLPTAPGLGVRLTPKLLQKYKFVPGTGARS